MQKITWEIIVLGMLPLDQSVKNVGAYIKLKIVVQGVFFYKGLGHTKEQCGEKKDSQPSVATKKYLEVLVDDEKIVQIQLDKDKICEDNHDLFLHIRVHMRWVHMDTLIEKT